MLINEPKVMHRDPFLAQLDALMGNGSGVTVLADGIYQIGHFGSSSFLRADYEQYPDLGDHGCYGVCDGQENLLATLSVLQDPARQFVVTLTSVRRADEPSDGGWRWHKWGEYIGKHEPRCEYLHDEEGIDEVFCYHVYEKKVALTAAGAAP